MSCTSNLDLDCLVDIIDRDLDRMQTRSKTNSSDDGITSSHEMEESTSPNSDPDKLKSTKMKTRSQKNAGDEEIVLSCDMEGNKSLNPPDSKKTKITKVRTRDKKDTNEKEISHEKETIFSPSANNPVKQKENKAQDKSGADTTLSSVERTVSNTCLTIDPPTPENLENAKAEKQKKKNDSNEQTPSPDQNGETTTNPLEACSSSTANDDVTKKDTKPKKKKTKNRGEHLPETKRFEVVTEEDLDNLANNTVTQNTKKQTGWAVKLFKGTIFVINYYLSFSKKKFE